MRHCGDACVASAETNSILMVSLCEKLRSFETLKGDDAAAVGTPHDPGLRAGGGMCAMIKGALIDSPNTRVETEVIHTTG